MTASIKASVAHRPTFSISPTAGGRPAPYSDVEWSVDRDIATVVQTAPDGTVVELHAKAPGEVVLLAKVKNSVGATISGRASIEFTA